MGNKIGRGSEKSAKDFKHALDTLAHDLVTGENSEGSNSENSGSYGE